MVTEFGTAKMAELLSALGAGLSVQRAVEAVYDMTLDDLENEWRRSIGADEYVAPTPAPTSSVANPTSTPNPLLPLTLEQIAAAGRVTPTPEPQPTSSPVVGEESPSPLAQADETPEPDAVTPGGSCNATVHTGPAQATPILGISALFLLGLWREARKRLG